MTNNNLRSLIDKANRPNNRFPKVPLSDDIDLTCIVDDGLYLIFYLIKCDNKYVGISYQMCCGKDVHIYIKKAYRGRRIAYNALHDHILPHQLYYRGTMFVTAISKAGKALMEKFNARYTEYGDYALNKEKFDEFPDEQWQAIADEMIAKLGLESLDDWWY